MDQRLLSPKENIQPKVSLSKQEMNTLTALIAYLQKQGITIPKNLEQQLGPGVARFSKLQQEVKALKVKLNENQFELKKMEEDNAQQRRNAKAEKEKITKRMEEACTRLQTSLADNLTAYNSWMQKAKESHQEQVKQLKIQNESILLRQTSSLKHSHEKAMLIERKRTEKLMQELKNCHQNEMITVIKQHQKEAKEIQEKHERAMHEIQMKHIQIVEAKERHYQSACIAAESAKKTEEKLHQKTKVQNNKAKQKLYTQLYYVKNVKKTLQDQLELKEQQIASLNGELKQANLTIQINLEKYTRAALEAQEVVGLRQRELESQFLDNQEKLHNYYLKEMQTKKEQIQKMKHLQEQQRSLWKQQRQELISHHEKRPSRKEDLEEIQQLKLKLEMAGEQIRCLQRELKCSTLQLENNEEIYSRMFRGQCASKNEKRKLTRDRDDRQSRETLCRKSQTTDVKFLLKVYNKKL